MKMSVLTLSLLLAGCATVNSALESANAVLGTVNETLGSVTGSTGGSTVSGTKVYNVGNKSTAAYEIKGLQMAIFGINPKSSSGFSGRAGAHFRGSLKNKTKTRIGVSFSVPVYNHAGQYTHSIVASTYAEPSETAVIDQELPAQIDWNSGQRPNVAKMKFGLQKF